MNPASLVAAQRIARSALNNLPAPLLAASGRALYSPVDTLTSGSRIYFLGINPGETENGVEAHDLLTVRADLLRLQAGDITKHGYYDEAWKGYPPGRAPIQTRGQRIFTILCEGDIASGEQLLRSTPTSNVILPRSPDIKALENRTGARGIDLARQCWSFHAAVIAECKCEVVLTHAVTIARKLARLRALGPGWTRTSGWGGTLNTLYAWELPEGPRLLAIPNLSRYEPGGERASKLAAFFREFGPK